MDAAGSLGEATAEGLSFDAVYEQYAGDVYRFCLSILGDPARAEDAAAAALASAYGAYRRTAPPPEMVRPWLFRIARNAATDELRRDSRWRRLVLRSGSAASAVAPRDPERDVLLRDELRAVVRAGARLGGRDRLIVSLRAAGGLEHGEIAAVLGVSEGAARVAAHRAFARLRRHLDEEARA